MLNLGLRIGSFVFCLLAAQSSFALYTPQQALADATSEPLTFLGSFIPASSQTGKYPDCVFKNSKAIVISSYCVKQNVPAGRLMILPAKADEGYIRLYAEVASGKDISQATHSEYLPEFFYTAVLLPQNSHDIGMSFEQIKNWSENETSDYSRMCVTSHSQPVQTNNTHCQQMPDGKAWSFASLDFLKNSDPNFVRLLKTIKAQVP